MVRTRGAFLRVCALLGIVSIVSIANAETPQQKADRLFAEGRKALTANDSAKACELFEEAIKLDVTATGTMLNLGLCYENLKRYATSLYWFRKAQSAASENKLTDYEEAAKQHTASNAPKVSIVSISVDGAPDADVRIDGKKVEPTEYGRVELDSGEHEIVGRTSGKKKFVHEFTIAEAETQPIVIAFKEAAVAEYVDRGSGRRKGAIILGAAGVATLIGVGVYGFIEKGIYEDRNTSESDANDARNRLKYLGTGLFVVGLGAATAAAILYFTAPGKEQISDGTAWVPTVSPDEIGVAYLGRF